ncbi:hypothetical protein GGI09_003522 [Coemansia sp. S100]|nr:hypothetical protein GGI09_003522 [Coemansia sp. S100]
MVLDWVVHRDADTGATSVYNSAKEVEECTSKHFTKHFTGNLSHAIELTGVWREEYAQRYDLGLEEVMRPIEEKEWDRAVAESPRGKAPGRSGVDFEMVHKMGPGGQEQLQAMCNELLELGNLPDGWTSANLIPIPKKLTTDRELEQYHLIALLEVGQKLLTQILMARMTAAIAEKGGLQGLNMGFQLNKQATDLGFAQQHDGGPIGMVAAAMADDLSLMGGSQEQLQEVMDATSEWFNMVGIWVNATKMEYL